MSTFLNVVIVVITVLTCAIGVRQVRNYRAREQWPQYWLGVIWLYSMVAAALADIAFEAWWMYLVPLGCTCVSIQLSRRQPEWRWYVLDRKMRRRHGEVPDEGFRELP